MSRLLLVLAIPLFIFQGCGEFRQAGKKPQVTVSPDKMELFVNQHTDPYTIRVNYTLNIPQNYIASCACLVFQPYFVASGQQYDLTPLVVSGKEYVRQEKRLEALDGKQTAYPDGMHLIASREGMKIRISEIVPFQLWMTQSKLRASVSLEACDRAKDLHDLILADGVIYLPLGPGPVLVKYVKEKTNIQKTALFELHYPTAQFQINPRYDDNEKPIQRINDFLDSLKQDTGMYLKKMIITGSSSPFGNSDFNKELAIKRVQQFKQYFIEHLHINQDLVISKYDTENWKSLRKLIESSSMSGKEAVFQILEGNYTDEQRKLLLQKLPQYEYILTHIFPQLQKVSCVFYYTQLEEVTRIIPE